LSTRGASLLVWTLIDVRERHLRLIRLLRELRGPASPAGREFLRAAGTLVERDLRQFEEQLSRVLSGADSEDPDAWSSQFRGTVVNLARQRFAKLALTQQELYPYLPLDRRPSADIWYFTARRFAMSANLESHRKRIAISFGRFSEWTSRVFQSETQAVTMIPIPLIETATPLRWPLLVHELAHWLLPGGASLAEVARPKLEGALGEHHLSTRSEATFAELFADQVAYRSCGPAYAYALASEAAVSIGGAHHATGALAPDLVTRLKALGPKVETWVSELPSEWFIGVTEKVPRLAEISAVVSELLERFRPSAVRDEVVKIATTALRAGQSISAVRTAAPLNEEDYRSLVSGADELKQAEFFRRAAEEPCTDAEILLAAWMCETDFTATEQVKRVRTAVAHEGLSLETLNNLARFDVTVSRSLQAAYVHSMLRRWDPKIRDNLGLAPWRPVGSAVI